jgi:hypothetical protein
MVLPRSYFLNVIDRIPLFHASRDSTFISFFFENLLSRNRFSPAISKLRSIAAN